MCRIRKAEKLMEELKQEKEQKLAVADNEKLKFLEAVRARAKEIRKSKEFIQKFIQENIKNFMHSGILI